MSTFSPAQLSELDTTLRDFDDGAIHRGQNYSRRGRVDAISWEPEAARFEARVRGTSVYTTRWWWEAEEGWNNSCTCPLGGWCKHAYALGEQALLAAAPAGFRGGNPNAVPVTANEPAAAAEDEDVESLGDIVVTALGRELKTIEQRTVKKLEDIFADVTRTGVVDTAAIAAFARTANPGLMFSGQLNPAMLREVFDPEHPPRSPLDFWQHLAVLFRERGWALPDVLVPVTDTAAVAARVVAQRKQREHAEWTKRLEALGPAGAESGPVVRRRLRLLIGPKALVFQSADAAGDYANLIADHLSEMSLRTDFAGAAQLWDTPSLVLLGLFQDAQPHGWSRQLTLREPAAAQALARALLHPDLVDRVVDAAGQPLVRAEMPLTWHFESDPANPEKQLVVDLRCADGTPAPQPLRYLGGPPHVYLSATTVYAGPAALHERGDAGWKASIPTEVVAQERVVRSLMRSGARLPPAIAARIEHVPLRPLVRADLSANRIGSECVRLAFSGIDGAGQRRVTLTTGGWSEKFRGAPPPPDDGRVIVHDTSTLAAAERQFAQLALDWDGETGTWTRLINKDTPDELAAWFQSFPADTVFELAPELAGLRDAPVQAAFELEIEESGRDWFDVDLVVRAQDTALTPAEVNLLLKAHGSWVRLEGKGWRRLTLAADESQQAHLAELGLSPDGALQGRQRFHALQLAAADLEEFTASRAWQTVQERARAISALPSPPVPEGLVGELRPYQREGFHFLAHLAANSLGGILADDMGLGKTVQALAWLLWLAERATPAKPLRVLVVCPKSVVTNWERETQRFAPGLSVVIFRAKGSASLPAGQVVVANYAQLRSAERLFLAEAWTAIILDEAQNIKNPQSQTAGTARKLTADHRLILTGTPIENRLLDLWSLFAFAMPGLLGGQTIFRKLYDDKNDPSARTRLARRVRHFLLRRTKGQVATDLPARIEEDVLCELEGEQLKLYQAELKRARQLVLGVEDQRGFQAQRFNILQSLLRLRQICCHPGLLGEDFKETPSAKVAALFDQLEPILAEGHKVLVFSQFVSMLNILQRELTAREIAFLTITGQTENRQELVDQFQSSPDVSVFLLSLKAAGAGLNLTAASYVVLFDPWWNPAVEAQAIDRTHRIGQKYQVIAYRLIAQDTVEEKIRQLQHEKAALARAVVQEESLATVMNLEDLRYVLG